MAQDRGEKRAVVNTLLNLRFPQNQGNLLTSRGTGSTQINRIIIIHFSLVTSLFSLVLLLNQW